MFGAECYSDLGDTSWKQWIGLLVSQGLDCSLVFDSLGKINKKMKNWRRQQNFTTWWRCWLSSYPPKTNGKKHTLEYMIFFFFLMLWRCANWRILNILWFGTFCYSPLNQCLNPKILLEVPQVYVFTEAVSLAECFMWTSFGRNISVPVHCFGARSW